MTALEKFMELGNQRESFLVALGLFNELDAEYRSRVQSSNYDPQKWNLSESVRTKQTN